MEEIAVIADIHGNLEALKSVLENIKSRNISKIICIGDIIGKGTHQHECIELVRKNCDIVLKGNRDNEFIDSNFENKKLKEKNRIIWNSSKLTDDDINFLKTLSYCYEFYMSGRLVRLFHASSEDINRVVGNIDKLENLYSLFLPSENTISDKKADVLIYGHIHTQFMQRIYNRTIINTGSVGNSMDIFRNDEKDGNVKNTTVANYIIIRGVYNSKDIDAKISYELISIPYDIEKELSANDDNIERDSYEVEIRNGKHRDMEIINKNLEKRGIDINKI